MLDMPLPVIMHQHVDNFFKQVGLLWAKEASSNLVNSLFQLRQAVVVLFSMVSKHRKWMINTFRKTQAHTCCCNHRVCESAAVNAYTEVPAGSPRPHLLKWKASAHVDKTFQSGSTDSARKKSLLKSVRDCRAAGLSERMELTALTAKYCILTVVLSWRYFTEWI